MGSIGGIGGLVGGGGTGIDVQGTVNQLIAAQSAPISLLQKQQQRLTSEVAAIRDINAKLADLSTRFNALKDVSGSFSSKSADSSQADVLRATAGPLAQSGIHTVFVSALATTSSYYTNQLADSATSFATGSFDLNVGTGQPVTVTVDSSNNNLDALASAINNLGVGVTANVITDAGGARLSLVSNATGAPGDLAISNNTSGLSFTKAVAGSDASLTVDGIPVTSHSNTLSTVIPGVTLNLLSAAPSTPITVSVKPDNDQASATIQDFVDAYNSVAQAISAQFSYSAATQQGKPLSGNSSLVLVQQQLLSSVTYSPSSTNGIGSLASIGVNLNNDGTLAVDSAKLESVLASNFPDVQSMFQSVVSGSFAQNFSSNLTTLNDSTTGALNIELNGINQTQSSLSDQITQMQDRLDIRRQQLLDAYAQVNAQLQQLPLILSQIDAQLGSLKGK